MEPKNTIKRKNTVKRVFSLEDECEMYRNRCNELEREIASLEDRLDRAHEEIDNLRADLSDAYNDMLPDPSL